MNNKKSRSSLKKVSAQTEEETDTAKCLKRRISFSGKKFIREFDTTEKPRDYDHSYEISDHTNGDDSSGQSHGTVASSVLQSTAHTAAEMDKENSPLSICLDDQQSLNDFTLKLQTSINVTLLPGELCRNRHRVESPAAMESMSQDSLSLYEVERKKLRENSVYNIPVFEKTMDLVPQRMVFADLDEPQLTDKENVQKTIIMSADISCVAQKEKDIKQKTVLFENNDITCDFSDIEPLETVAAADEVAKPAQENDSLDMGDRDYMNYLADDSTLSSPLIPLDVISENGISKKLNFRQLNEALNSGRIQLFPNGPKTPTTDRTAKQHRFWHGLEQQPMEQDVPLRDSIKPRGTLNFNDSIIVSPVSQKSEPQLKTKNEESQQAVPVKSSAKCNYRFSQADELMLDNTNFLVNAKMGDETQSRNGSKCSSRRETTYETTAMELDDLEKQEAVVAAALDTAKLKKTMQRIEAKDEGNFSSQCKIPTDAQATKKYSHTLDEKPQQLSNPRQTLHMVEPIEEISFGTPNEFSSRPTSAPKESHQNAKRQTLHRAEPMEEISFGSPNEFSLKPTAVPTKSQSNKKRQTMHMAEPIEEDILIPQVESKPQQAVPTLKQQYKIRRQTVHSAEAIEEDIVQPRQELQLKAVAPAVENQYSKRRQSLHCVESMDEDSFCAHRGVPATKPNHSKQRQTMHMTEAIEEDIVRPKQELKPQLEEKQYTKRRQTLHLADPIEEDSFCAQKELKQVPTKIWQMEESMEEEVPKAASTVEPEYNRHQHSQIEEDSFCAQKELKQMTSSKHTTMWQMEESIEEEVPKQQHTAAITVEQQSNRRRETLHLADPIEEDSFCAPIKSHAQLQSQTAALPPEKPSTKHRQTLIMSESMQEDVISSHKERNVKPKGTPAPKHMLKSRQTLNVAVPIEEVICNAAEALRLDSDPSMSRNDKKSRRTFLMEEAIEEDYILTKPASPVKVARPRPTLHTQEAIVEEWPTAPPAEQRYSKPKPKVVLTESMEMEMLSQSISEVAEKAGDAVNSDSAEWLAQMRSKVRQNMTKSMPIKLEFASPAATANRTIKNESQVNRTSLETPKMNKKLLSMRSNYFAITPGRSMIEYEDLEKECKSDSPAPPAARTIYQTVDMSLDMNTSDFSSPVAAPKQASFNVKRLPIHLTPNLPQPKKRHSQYIQIEDENTSPFEVDTSSRQNVEQFTGTARNRSRIPVLSKTLSSPWREADQFDGTVQMVRAQMMRQANSHFETGNTDMLEDKLRTAAGSADNPITISDVSSHFAPKRSLANSAEQPKDSSGESRNSNDNRSFAIAHKKYINLSGDTVIFAAADLLEGESEIDKTRLSLVPSLLDDEDDGENDAGNSSNMDYESMAEAEACLEQLNPPAVAGDADACKKCKHCRRSVEGARNNTSNDSIELPDWRELSLGLEHLEKLRQRPRLADVHRYWELKKLERYSNAGDETTNATNETCSDLNTNRLTLPQMLEKFNNTWEDYKKKSPIPKPVETFVKRLETSLRDQLPNWIFDYQLQCHRTYIFSHRKLTTCRIIVNYEPSDFLETEIRVRSIKLDPPTIIPIDQWTVFEHLMDFQLKLNLPLNLDNLLDGNSVEAFVKFLQHIDRTCIEVGDICHNMHLVLLKAHARLLREPNRNVARKTVSRFVKKKEDEAYMRVEKIDFRIEIGNVKEISFKDILEPPLYQFDENIQFLPKGIAFLAAFMQTPEQYLKRNVEPNDKN